MSTNPTTLPPTNAVLADRVPANVQEQRQQAVYRYETELYIFLGRLEHQRWEFEEAMPSLRPNAVIQQLERLVNEVVQFSDNPPPGIHFSNAELTLALNKAGEFSSNARQLQENLPATGFRAFFGLAGEDPKVASERHEQYQRCLVLALETIEGFFRLFTGGFPTSIAARNWVDVAAVFMVQLKQNLMTFDQA